MDLIETSIQSSNWDSLTSEYLQSLPVWLKYSQHLNDFLDNNISESNSKLHKLLAKMDDSDDTRKRKSNNILSDWTNNPFERVNHSTNFEDYACSSDDTNYLYTSSDISVNKTDSLIPSKVTQTTSRDSVSNPINKICVKPSVNPMICAHLSDQKDCLSAGNSSADVTPSGTPQSSPYSIRKAMESNKIANNNNNNNKKNLLSANPKRWFYTGFFNTELKPANVDKSLSPLPKNPSFSSLCVSNFDINAVGPTSW